MPCALLPMRESVERLDASMAENWQRAYSPFFGGSSRAEGLTSSASASR